MEFSRPSNEFYLRHERWLEPVLLVAATLAVFAPVALLPSEKGGGFLLDDVLLLTDNPLIKAPGWGGLWDIWFSRKNPDYFPLMSTTLWVEWRLWGMNAWGYHLTNVLLHTGSALLLWRIFLRLRIPAAALAALLFAIHPVNVESVAWIAERKNTLSLCLACASLLCLLRSEERKGWGWYAGSILLFILALLSKTAVVMLPWVLLILVVWRRGRIRWRHLARALPFFAASLVLGLVTIWFQHGNAIADTVVRDDSALSRIATAGCAVWFYLGKAVFPIDIMFNYPRWNVMSAWGTWALLPTVALVTVLGVLSAIRRAWSRGLLAALGIYIAMLLPVLGLHPALNIFFMRYSLVSDHWQYPAIPAICALLGAMAYTLIHKADSVATRRAVYAVTTVALAAMATYSFSIAALYRSAEDVWLDTVAHNPNSWLAHAHLGEIYLERGRNDPQTMNKAIIHLARVVEIVPDQAVGYTNLGNGYRLAGMDKEAMEAYRRALAAPLWSHNEKAYAFVNLGALLAKSGNLTEAQEQFRNALELSPDNARAHYYLGMTQADAGDLEAAQKEITRAAALGLPEAARYLQRLDTLPASKPNRTQTRP